MFLWIKGKWMLLSPTHNGHLERCLSKSYQLIPILYFKFLHITGYLLSLYTYIVWKWFGLLFEGVRANWWLLQCPFHWYYAASLYFSISVVIIMEVVANASCVHIIVKIRKNLRTRWRGRQILSTGLNWGKIARDFFFGGKRDTVASAAAAAVVPQFYYFKLCVCSHHAVVVVNGQRRRFVLLYFYKKKKIGKMCPIMNFLSSSSPPCCCCIGHIKLCTIHGNFFFLSLSEKTRQQLVSVQKTWVHCHGPASKFCPL